MFEIRENRTSTRRSRKTMRLPGHDYSSGSYFVTICTHQGRYHFGQVIGENVHLSSVGKIVEEEWGKTDQLRSDVSLDRYVIMPDHFHAVIGLHQKSKLGHVIALFKSAVTKRISNNITVWQRGYYEHIIRDDRDMYRIQKYISNNPARWSMDMNKRKMNDVWW